METSTKRPLEDKNELETKRIKTEQHNILHFSDCVLLKILSHLKSYDLYCLSYTCQRFKYLIKERKLWKKLDTLDHPMCARKFKFFFENIHNSTDTVMVRGISRKEKTLTFSQFIKMCKICDSLTILAIENQYINSDEIGMKDFPQTLEELSLRGTHIYGKHPFLQEAHLKLRKLHTLILDDCKWFHEHSLMALSKLKNLENLSLYKCANLNDSVAYMSITAKFGFRKLLRIDARCTSVGDQFLKCFHCIKTLREIYLEAPQRSRNSRNARTTPRKCNRSTATLLDQLHRLCGQALSRSSTVNNVGQPGAGTSAAASAAATRGAATSVVAAVAAAQAAVQAVASVAAAPAGEQADGGPAGAPAGQRPVIGAGASAVVFNRSQFFNLRRDYRPKQKRPKKSQLSSARARNASFNCLESCVNCSIETCSIIPVNNQLNDNQAECSSDQSQSKESPCTSTSKTTPASTARHAKYQKYCRSFRPSFSGYITFRDPNRIEIEPDRVYYQRSVQNNLRAVARAAEQCIERRNAAIRREQSDCHCEPSTSGPAYVVDDGADASANEERPSSPFELYYCDDISDSEDEAEAEAVALLELDMLQADVTDFGVQWFCSAVPDEDDYQGQPTTLFRRPYKDGDDCHCKDEDKTKKRNGPGPSGYKPPVPPAEPLPSTSKGPYPPVPKAPSSVPSTSNNPSQCPNDVTVNVSGQGPLCLKIAYETSEPNEYVQNGVEVPANANPPAADNRDLRVIIQGEAEMSPPERVDNYPIRGRLIIENSNRDEQNDPPQRCRDLRVIIERLDPGVHIVYDQGGRQFDNAMRDSSTRLKVFVARGYKLITNNALRSLMSLRLELLDVTGTGVNAKGVKEFLMFNPDCKVIHESTCHCTYNG